MKYHNIILYYSVAWIMNVYSGIAIWRECFDVVWIMNVYSGIAIWKECFDVVWIMNGVLINEEKLFIINYSPV